MGKKADILRWMYVPVLLLASACGYDHLVEPATYPDEPETPYVEIRISMPANDAASTRSNPMGGEEGNGREQGLDNEDRINDINIFFYLEETSGKGMDSHAETPIINHIFYNLKDSSDPLNSQLWLSGDEVNEPDDDDNLPYFEKNYLVLKLKCTDADLRQVESTGINFVTLANVGPMQDINTLGELRNYDLSLDKSNAWCATYDACSKDASKMDYFLMSTAYNENYAAGGQTTGTNKITKEGSEYKGKTTLQRMYARIDLWYNEKENAIKAGDAADAKVKQLQYKVENATGNIVYVTNVMPVNIMKRPSYVFKKVTNDKKADWTSGSLKSVSSFKWGGKETPEDGPYDFDSDGDLPQNYVMEWHTTDKKPGGATSDTDLSKWFGSTAVKSVKENILKDILNADNTVDNGKFSAYYHETRTAGIYDPDYDCDHISIISYANENTHPTDCFHSNYLTGLAFRAVYVPEKIYKAYTSAGGILTELTDAEKENFPMAAGHAIYRYSPSAEEDGVMKESKALYFSDEEAMNAYHKNNLVDSSLIMTY